MEPLRLASPRSPSAPRCALLPVAPPHPLCAGAGALIAEHPSASSRRRRRRCHRCRPRRRSRTRRRPAQHSSRVDPTQAAAAKEIGSTELSGCLRSHRTSQPNLPHSIHRSRTQPDVHWPQLCRQITAEATLRFSRGLLLPPVRPTLFDWPRSRPPHRSRRRNEDEMHGEGWRTRPLTAHPRFNPPADQPCSHFRIRHTTKLVHFDHVIYFAPS